MNPETAPLISQVMNLDLSDEQAAALANELDGIVSNDRYLLSLRIQTLKAVLAKLRFGADPPAIARAQALRSTASHPSRKAAARLGKSEPVTQ